MSEASIKKSSRIYPFKSIYTNLCSFESLELHPETFVLWMALCLFQHKKTWFTQITHFTHFLERNLFFFFDYSLSLSVPECLVRKITQIIHLVQVLYSFRKDLFHHSERNFFKEKFILYRIKCLLHWATAISCRYIKSDVVSWYQAFLANKFITQEHTFTATGHQKKVTTLEERKTRRRQRTF